MIKTEIDRYNNFESLILLITNKSNTGLDFKGTILFSFKILLGLLQSFHKLKEEQEESVVMKIVMIKMFGQLSGFVES